MSPPGPRPADAVRLRLAVAAGAVLLVLGLWGTFVREVAFGWTSFTPLVSESTLVSGAPRTVVLDAPGMLLLAALLGGVALLAGAAGYLTARRA